MLNPDKRTMEWCAEWIEGALKSETNERTIEFGKNMAMTFRALLIDSMMPQPAVADSANLDALAERINTNVARMEESQKVDPSIKDLTFSTPLATPPCKHCQGKGAVPFMGPLTAECKYCNGTGMQATPPSKGENDG